jgi:hypothetical protein
VTVRINHVNRVVELNTLVLDHLRRLCKNLGIRHVGSLSKFEIRKSIATYFDGMDNMEKNGISPTTVASRRTNTILRLVNIIFGEHFIEDFLNINVFDMYGVQTLVVSAPLTPKAPSNAYIWGRKFETYNSVQYFDIIFVPCKFFSLNLSKHVRN